MSEARSPSGWRSWLDVGGGLAAGALATWAVGIVAGVFGYGIWGDDVGYDGDSLVFVLAPLALVPLLGLFLVLRRDARSWAAIGFAVGSIVGSGVCASVWVSQ